MEAQLAKYDEGTIHEFREHVLDIGRTIVSGYKVTSSPNMSSGETLSYPTQLAYLRARNIINVGQLFSAHYKQAPQEVIDKISDQALKIHHWGRDVYWRAITDIQRHSFHLACKEGVSDLEMAALCIDRLYSQGKIDEIERKVRKGGLNARFPGLVKNSSAGLNPLELFEIIRRDYDPKNHNSRFMCKIIELAQHSAVDTLALKACFDSQDYITFNQAKDQYERAKVAHQERGISFWEPVHEVDLFCYERACREKALPMVIEKLRERLEKSGDKLSKLDRRHRGVDECIGGGPDSMELIKLMKSIAGNNKLDMMTHYRFDLDPRKREELFQLLLQSYIDDKSDGKKHRSKYSHRP